MRVQNIVEQLKNGKELTDEQKQFIINKWTSKPLIKNEKYGSNRCPNCNIVLYYGHYCMQCGQKIKLKI